jgi:hypothetical protein
VVWEEREEEEERGTPTRQRIPSGQHLIIYYYRYYLSNLAKILILTGIKRDFFNEHTIKKP